MLGLKRYISKLVEHHSAWDTSMTEGDNTNTKNEFSTTVLSKTN